MVNVRKINSSTTTINFHYIQGVSGGNVNILEGQVIGHSKQKSVYVYVHVSYSERFPR